MWYCLLIASCYISKIFAGYFFNQQLFHILECYDTGLLTCDKIEFAVNAAYITTRIGWANCHFSAFGENYFRNEWNTQEKVLYTPCVNSRCFLLARLRLYSVIFQNSSLEAMDLNRGYRRSLAIITDGGSHKIPKLELKYPLG